MGDLNKREFIKATSLLGVSAAVPALAKDENPDPPATPLTADLVDGHFTSATGRRFGTQVMQLRLGDDLLPQLPSLVGREG